MCKIFNRLLPCTTCWLYFDRIVQRISHWDDPSWPTKSFRSNHSSTKKWNVLVLNRFIKWFQLHLSTREIFVTLENVFSYAGLINCGVPQGSILGLLFFLIYINDLPQALNETGSYFYAGDTCTFYQNKDVFLNKEFSSLCSWFIDKKL